MATVEQILAAGATPCVDDAHLVRQPDGTWQPVHELLTEDDTLPFFAQMARDRCNIFTIGIRGGQTVFSAPHDIRVFIANGATGLTWGEVHNAAATGDEDDLFAVDQHNHALAAEQGVPRTYAACLAAGDRQSQWARYLRAYEATEAALAALTPLARITAEDICPNCSCLMEPTTHGAQTPPHLDCPNCGACQYALEQAFTRQQAH